MKHILTALIILLATPVWSQASYSVDSGYCNTDEIAHQFILNFDEQSIIVLGRGEDSLDENEYIEVWLNPDTGTWTITHNRDDGTTCLLFTGSQWSIGRGENVPVPPEGDPL